MTNHKTAKHAFITLLSATFLAFPVVAAAQDGVMMKDGKMMMMKDGKATGPMDHVMTMTDGHTVLIDGTITMRMKEGQMMTMDGKMMQDGKPMEGGMGMMGGKEMMHDKGMMGGMEKKDGMGMKADPGMKME